MSVNRNYRRGGQWMRVNHLAWFLAYEASNVILLRVGKLALGGRAAQSEARRMVQEKVAAASTLQSRAVSGGLGRTADEFAAKTLSHYRKKVRANRRRLLKPPK